MLRELLSAGYRVRATARGDESRDRVLARFEDAAGLTVVPADLTDPEAVQAAVNAAR